MTVWIASKPMRGHLVEKSLVRVAGTISGTVIGVSLTAVSACNSLRTYMKTLFTDKYLEKLIT